MSIFVAESEILDSVNDYFYYNQVPFTKISIFDPSINDHTLNQPPLQTSNSTLIIDLKTFAILLKNEKTFNEVTSFIQQGNKIISLNRMDGINIVDQRISNELLILDQQVNHNDLTIFVDGALTADSKVYRLEKIKIIPVPWNFFMQFPLIHDGNVEKINCKWDFLLTMIKKPTAPHREILWNQLVLKQHLVKKGCVSYQPNTRENWIGKKPLIHQWADGHPSMDLYLNSWVELVPETRYHNCLFVTEKTIKPLATKTPFLVLSTPGYLQYLRGLGFKTFHSIIDESYDSELDLENRVSMIINQLEKIIEHGAGKFYNDVQEILIHNQNRLFEISGRRQFDLLSFYRQNLLPLLQL